MHKPNILPYLFCTAAMGSIILMCLALSDHNWYTACDKFLLTYFFGEAAYRVNPPTD